MNMQNEELLLAWEAVNRLRCELSLAERKVLKLEDEQNKEKENGIQNHMSRH